MAPLIRNWRGFSAGQRVAMLIATAGATPTDEEVAYPAGTYATIHAAADFGKEYVSVQIDRFLISDI